MGRRDDGAVMIDVPGSQCVLVVLTDEDSDTRVWANVRDSALARGGWQDASGDIPEEFAAAAREHIKGANWCDFDPQL